MRDLKPFSIYRHHSGRLYFFIGVANKHSTNTDKFPPLAVYIGVGNFRMWARPVEEFADPEKFTFHADVSYASARRFFHSFVGSHYTGENNV